MSKLPNHMQATHEIRDGFIIKKGETDPAIFAAMESIKQSMLRKQQNARQSVRVASPQATGAPGTFLIVTDEILLNPPRPHRGRSSSRLPEAGCSCRTVPSRAASLPLTPYNTHNTQQRVDHASNHVPNQRQHPSQRRLQ
jgi:hypothetical protein